LVEASTVAARVVNTRALSSLIIVAMAVLVVVGMIPGLPLGTARASSDLVSLSVVKAPVPGSPQVTLAMAANLPTASPDSSRSWYAVAICDQDGGVRFWRGKVAMSTGDTALSYEWSASVPAPSRSYRAVMLPYYDDERAACANPTSANSIAVSDWVTAAWPTQYVSLTARKTSGGWPAELRVVTDYPVDDTGLSILIYDVTAGGTPDRTCYYGATCTLDSKAGHVYQAVVGGPETVAQDRLTRVAAKSGLIGTQAFGPTANEISGGGKPQDSNCSQLCEGDPVNTYSGIYWDSVDDLALASPGPEVAWSRRYSSENASKSGPLGAGWSTSYDLQVRASGTGSATVVQEDGGQVTFAKNAAGEWTAAGRVFATLTQTADGGWDFYRRNQHLTYHFNATGRLTSIVDLNGATTTLTYVGDRLTAVTGVTGRTLTVGWTGDRITSVSDATGAAVTYGYDGAGRLVTATSPSSGPVTYTYDAANRLATKADTTGTVLTNTYDQRGRVTRQTDALNQPTTFTYTTSTSDPDFQQTAVEDPRQNTTTYTYWGGVLQRTETPAGTTNYAWDPETLSPTLVIDPAGGSTRTTYDAQGDATSTTDASGARNTQTYDARGLLLSQTDPLGVTTMYSRDQTGNVTSISTPLDATHAQTTRAEYTDARHPGAVTATIDALGKRTTYAYNAAGDLTTVTDPLGNKTTYAYDSRGHLTSVTRPSGNVPGADPATARTTWTRDAAGRVLTETDALGRTTATTYTATGTVDTVTDSLGNVTDLAYDPLGHLTSTRQADGTTTSTGYDAAGNVTSQTDAAGHQTTYAYDAANRPTSVTDPLGNKASTTWTGLNLPATVTDPLGKTTTYRYDDAGRLTDVRYVDTGMTDLRFGYDAAGRRTTMTDATGTTTYAYDALNRLTAVNNASGSGRAIGYAYDLNGQITGLTYPNGQVTQRTYDAAGHWTGLTDWTGAQYAFAYDADGNLTQQANPNGVTATADTDATGQITDLTWTHGTTMLADFGYEHDSNGQTTRRTITGATTDDDAYGYNGLGALATINGATQARDTTGNLLTLPDGATLTYNAAGQATQRTSATRTSTYVYDPKGNRTTSDSATLTWDQANHLTTHVSPTGTTGYTYTGDGLRATKTTGSTTERFVWDTQAGAGLMLTDGATNYLYGPGDRLLAQQPTTSGPTIYPVTDAIGTIHALTDQTGSVVGNATYDEHGTTLTRTGTQTPFGFAGEYRDNESGLIYLRARYYDPDTAQFISPDPLNAVTQDAYGYARGNPVSLTDPTGLDWYNPFSWSEKSWDRADSVGKTVGIVAAVAATGLLVVGTGGAAAPVLGLVASGATAISLGISGAVTAHKCAPDPLSGTCASAAGDMAWNVLTWRVGSNVQAGIRNPARHRTSADSASDRNWYLNLFAYASWAPVAKDAPSIIPGLHLGQECK
jgi:RHS repeat-associated protein